MALSLSSTDQQVWKKIKGAKNNVSAQCPQSHRPNMQRVVADSRAVHVPGADPDKLAESQSQGAHGFHHLADFDGKLISGSGWVMRADRGLEIAFHGERKGWIDDICRVGRFCSGKVRQTGITSLSPATTST
jgi:hypothetical protein